jgi:chromosome segregation ATPase
MEDHKQTQNDALSPSLPAKSAPLKAEVSSQLPNPQSSQPSLTPAQEAAFLTRLNTLLTSTDDLASAIPVPQRSPAYLDSLRTSTGPSFLTNLHSLFNSLQSRAVELFEEYKGKRKMSRLMQRQKEALDRAAQVELEDMLAREQRLQVHLQDIKSAANSHEIEEDAIKKTVLQVNRDLSETEVMLRSLKRVRDDLQVQLDRLESNLNQLRQKEYSLDEEATYLEEEVKSLRAQIKEKEMLLDERSCMFQTISLENEELLVELLF